MKRAHASVILGLFLACSPSNPPPTSPTSTTASAPSTVTSSAPSAKPAATCEFSLANAKLDCDKAWKNYGVWIKAKCTTGKPDSEKDFMDACKNKPKPGVVASYGCFERHSGCDDVLACETPCFEQADGNRE